jgi:hypothetical protein
VNAIVEHNWTLEDFERWLALQLSLGFRVKDQEPINKIRSELKRGATMSPMQKVTVETRGGVN